MTHMIRRTSTITFSLSGTMFQDYDPTGLLFFDIETTGFTAKTSSLYLIGAIALFDGDWTLSQWLAETPEEEAEVLSAFLSFAASYKQLIHFNGDRFDLPYLKEKCAVYHLNDTLSFMISRDLYRSIRPLKKLLRLPALNQRCIEEFLGICRKDPYSGGELIDVYKNYCLTGENDDLQKLFLHNHDDLLGMIHILPVLSYQVLLSGSFQITQIDMDDSHFLMYGRLPLCLPQAFSCHSPLFYIAGEQDRIAFQVNGISGIMKYFFPDYKNYYYLPEEDIALHKSVAAFVDREHREPAKASNCYNKKKGFYLPQFEELHRPVFRTDYADKQMYFACNEKFMQDGRQLYEYACHLLANL